MTPFTNDHIDTAGLPRYEEVPLTPVSALYWKVILINLSISFLILGAIISTIFFLIGKLSGYTALILVIYVLFFTLLYFLEKKAFERRAYAVRQHDIIFRRGTLATISTIIPFQRIQHVNVNEGMISRAYGLAQLQIFTAGSAGSDIKISGLLREDAVIIKELILKQMSENEI